MDERTGEMLENYPQDSAEVEVVLSPPRLVTETFSSDFEWPEEDETVSKKRKYSKKSQEVAKVIQPKVSKKPKKQACQLQQPSKIRASKSRSHESGIFTLFILKCDLDDHLKPKSDASLWRRDGNELLQKYLRLQVDDETGVFFVPTPVYAIWEDERRNEYLEVKVKYAEPANDFKVKLVAIDMGRDWEDQHVVEFSEDSMISFDDGSFDGPLDDNCIIIEEIFVNNA